MFAGKPEELIPPKLLEGRMTEVERLVRGVLKVLDALGVNAIFTPDFDKIAKHVRYAQTDHGCSNPTSAKGGYRENRPGIASRLGWEKGNTYTPNQSGKSVPKPVLYRREPTPSAPKGWRGLAYDNLSEVEKAKIKEAAKVASEIVAEAYPAKLGYGVDGLRKVIG
jgi:hypothetical protein